MDHSKDAYAMIVAAVLARQLIGRESVSFEPFVKHPNCLPLFGDWDGLRLIPVQDWTEIESVVSEVDMWCLDRRVTFAWVDKRSPSWEESRKSRSVFAYVELQVTPWLLEKCGLDALYAGFSFCEETVKGISASLSPTCQLDVHMFLGLGQSDLVGVIFGDTLDDVLEAIIALRGAQLTDFAGRLGDRFEGVRRTIDAGNPSVANNHAFAWFYWTFGYCPASTDGFDDIEHSVANVSDSRTTELRPAIFVACRPGHGRGVIASIGETLGGYSVSKVSIQGVFDLCLRCDTPSDVTFSQRQAISGCLAILKHLYRERAAYKDVVGTSTVWERRADRNLPVAKWHDSLINYNVRRLNQDGSTVSDRLPEWLSDRRRRLLASLATICDIASTHPLTSTYVLDLRRYVAEFIDWIVAHPTANADSDNMYRERLGDGIETFSQRLLLGLLARSAIGTHALHTEPVFHPGVGIHKIVLALNQITVTLFNHFHDNQYDKMKEGTRVLFSLSPVGFSRGLVLFPSERAPRVSEVATRPATSKAFILYETAPDFFFRGKLHEAIHDIFHRIRLPNFDRSRLMATLVAELSLWFARALRMAISGAQEPVAENYFAPSLRTRSEAELATKATSVFSEWIGDGALFSDRGLFVAVGRNHVLQALLSALQCDSSDIGTARTEYIDALADHALRAGRNIQTLWNESRADVLACAVFGHEYLTNFAAHLPAEPDEIMLQRHMMLNAIVEAGVTEALPEGSRPLLDFLLNLYRKILIQVRETPELSEISTVMSNVSSGGMPSSRAVAHYLQLWASGLQRLSRKEANGKHK